MTSSQKSHCLCSYSVTWLFSWPFSAAALALPLFSLLYREHTWPRNNVGPCEGNFPSWLSGLCLSDEGVPLLSLWHFLVVLIGQSDCAQAFAYWTVFLHLFYVFLSAAPQNQIPMLLNCSIRRLPRPWRSVTYPLAKNVQTDLQCILKTFVSLRPRGCPYSPLWKIPQGHSRFPAILHCPVTLSSQMTAVQQDQTISNFYINCGFCFRA